MENGISDNSAEGEEAINSQAKGPDLDGTLERQKHPRSNFPKALFGRREKNLSGKKTGTRR